MSSPAEKLETRLLSGPKDNSPLQACPSCDAVIDITEHDPLSPVTCPGCNGVFTVHGWIDHFRLVEVAGKGGMGVVYRGVDTTLNRAVAIKLLLREHSAREDFIANLQSEAAITASINHANVIKVYSTGRDHGRFFIVMELANKGSLDSRMRQQGKLPEDEILDVGIQAAKGLRAAHQHGLIHRDVKPGNILFSDKRTAKIVDFGLAVFVDQNDFVAGELWGTPYYIAPEKLDYLPEDARSDMYSLGGTLFHALTGRPPFEAEDATTVAMKRLKHPAVSLQTFAPWVSSSTAYVINRLLQKDPDERYQTYDELIEHLEFAREELRKRAEHPEVAPKRVVLETAEDQQRLGWVVIAMLAACILLVGGLFLFRQQIFNHPGKAVAKTQQPIPVEPPNADALSKFAFADELQLLIKSDPAAAESFRKAGVRDNLTPADRTWASLLEGAAELDAGRIVEARTAFNKVQALATATGDPNLTQFFIGTAARLSTENPIPVSDATDIDGTNYEAIVPYIYGLKNWQLDKFDDSAALFRHFSRTTPSDPYAWIAALKGSANRRLDQLTAFDAQAAALKRAKTANQRAQIAAAFKQMDPQLAARGEDLMDEFPPSEPSTSGQPSVPTTITDGLYRIVNRKSGLPLLPDPTNQEESPGLIQGDGSTNAGGQEWVIEKRSGGGAFHRILTRSNGQALSASNPSGKKECAVVQRRDMNHNSQRWQINEADPGYFKLSFRQIRGSKQVMTVPGRSAKKGAAVMMTTDNNAPEQQWQLIRIGDLPP